MKTLKISFVLFAFSFTLANFSHADVTQWRTEVQATTGGNGVPLVFANDGDLNEASSAVSLSASGASSQASAALNAGGFVPTLRARATNDGRRSQAIAWGVQGYTNTSATALDTSLDMNFTGSITGSNTMSASVYLFEDENFEYSIDPGTLLFESSSQLWDGFEPFANNSGPTGFDVFANAPGSVDEQRSFDFTVQPGDSFYIWARVLTTASNTGTADAFSTLTASFSNTTGLVPAAAAVPEPGSGVLLALGSVAILFRRQGRC